MTLKRILILSLLLTAAWNAGARNRAGEIERQIRPVTFPERDFRITDFGAEAGGEADCRPAVAAAIDRCSREGGGRVVIPAGRWFSKGPVVLKSHVNLHLEAGAVLFFSSDEADYLPAVLTRWEGTEVYNYSPLIYAWQATNIAVTGQGVIDGRGSHNFAHWKPRQKADQKALRRMGTDLVPVSDRLFGEGHYLRPAMLEPVNCTDVLIEGVTFVDSPFWVIHPLACENVTVRGVTVDSYNLNNDGCDPESCTNVLIEDCTFRTGDDGIAIKSGRDNDAWRIGRPTENVLIRNCSFRSKANGVCIGSEISGGVRNVVVENVRMSDVGNGIYFKSNLDRGGYIEDVFVCGVEADSVRKTLVLFEPDYKSESRENHPTAFRGFVIEDVRAQWAGKAGIDIRGFADMPVRDVTISRLTLASTPEPVIVRNAAGIILSEVTINGERQDRRDPDACISLNGKWEVAIADTMPQTYAAKVPVPGVITMATPSLGEDLDAVDNREIGYDYVWYRRTFTLDGAAYPRALLRLRAKYNAQVFLNGREIGCDPHTTYSHGTFDLSEAIDYDGANELVVRVGSWNTATTPSKENSAEWWRNSRAPGIWDDVTLCLGQSVSIDHLKILPEVPEGRVRCVATLVNTSTRDERLAIEAAVCDDMLAVSRAAAEVFVPAGGSAKCELMLPADMLRTWSAGKEGTPWLYRMEVTATNTAGVLCSRKSERFGYRSIETRGRDVLVNGEKVLFRAENIAFVRALNRWADVMFDEAWIRRFLRVAVQEYNFNYLRFHLGHAYGKWYDIADEEGIMIQDEWRFMHDDEPTGKDLDDTETEFRRWISENVNHPSIVAWDQENEGNVRLEALKAELRRYDPTRLWGEDDYDAKHIYEYSENVVKDFSGYTISDTKPSTVLESCRLWTNEFGRLEPRENFKTSRTASGWGLYYYDRDDIARLLSDLHADIGTFYRSRRLQAWAPFALLSGAVNGHNFYRGDIADSLSPQPNLLVLKRLNEPIGTSVEMNQAREWYKDKTLYRPGAEYRKTIWVWNDLPRACDVRLRVLLVAPDGTKHICADEIVPVAASSAVKREIRLTMPRTQGVCLVEPRLTLPGGREVAGVRRRLMVARNASKVAERMAFGGRRTPVAGGWSILEHFTGSDIPDPVRQGIIAAAGDGLIDRIDVSGTPEVPTYIVQSTRYESHDRLHLTTTTFDAEGRVRDIRRAEAMPYVNLPAPVRRTIVEVVGSVPVDESRVIRRGEGDETTYEITMIGSDLRYKLRITDDGVLHDKKVTRKKAKK